VARVDGFARDPLPNETAASARGMPEKRPDETRLQMRWTLRIIIVFCTRVLILKYSKCIEQLEEIHVFTISALQISEMCKETWFSSSFITSYYSDGFAELSLGATRY
jgi:hypothetical protein